MTEKISDRIKTYIAEVESNLADEWTGEPHTAYRYLGEYVYENREAILKMIEAQESIAAIFNDQSLVKMLRESAKSDPLALRDRSIKFHMYGRAPIDPPNEPNKPDSD